MKILVGSTGDAGAYTFDASAQTVTITGLGLLSLENFILITNVTFANTKIYEFVQQPGQPNLGGVLTGIAGNQVLALTFDTTAMADTDDLQIFVIDPSVKMPVTANAGTNLNTSLLALETGGNLASIKARTDNIPPQGQALAAASLPVVLPAAQVTALTPPAAITNFANETGGNLAAIKAKTDNIPPLGQALATASVPVVLTAAQLTTLTPLGSITANQGSPNTAANAWPTTITDGTDTAEVNTRTDGIKALEVSDDMTSAETFRQALVASTDTTITFTQPVRLVRVKNESLIATVFVRDGAIASDTPANAEMVGVAPVANLPTVEYYPFKTSTVHLRSAGTPTISVTGFF